MVLVFTARLIVMYADVEAPGLFHELSLVPGLLAGRVGDEVIGYPNVIGELT